MDIDDDDAFLCPQCGEAMTPGEIGLSARQGLSVSWRDVDAGEAGPPGTIFAADGEGTLVRPGLVCRPCASILVDFQLQPGQGTEAGPRTFEERTRDMHGEVDLDALVKILREGDPRQCSKAIQAFVAIGAPAVPRLEELCEDEDPDVRVDAQKALERIREES
ncbi:MAG: HEAT repeat domain-containing protein [Planctomycetota bacterium]|nr:HEAT repeat domain-containing protein [Planctomycetota bacterium]